MTLRTRLQQWAGLRHTAWLDRHRYSTPVFLLRETWAAFGRHNGFNLSASLSLYALFALIPMGLLMFFLLSHLVVSSSYAIAELTSLTGNLMPKFSHRIMIEVYNISRHTAVWGWFGMAALLLAVTPLAGALRAIFHTVATAPEHRPLWRRLIMDTLAVLAMLLLFFLFSVSGVMLEKLPLVARLLAVTPLAEALVSLGISTLLLGVFYRVFFPAPAAWRHILAGSLLTAGLWLAMRPVLGLFLLVNPTYGTIFGGMKNMFVSLGWLYYSFTAFLLGTELIAALRKRDVLLLKDLFNRPQAAPHYLRQLTSRFGQHHPRDTPVFRTGESGNAMYYLVSGAVEVRCQGKVLRHVAAGDYFGEMALLAEEPRGADAVVVSDTAVVLHIRATTLEALLHEEPGIALDFLRDMAKRLRHSSGIAPAL